MAEEPSIPSVAVAADNALSLDEVLDEDAQVEVLRAAKAAGVLEPLASSSQQLCRLARSRVPVELEVQTQAHAEMVIMSQACGRPPFSACTQLSVTVDNPSSRLIAVCVLNAVQHWEALARVDLALELSADQLQPDQTLDYWGSGILSTLPALRGLRRLALDVPDFGTCSARQLGQLVQLTGLQLSCTAPAAADAVPVDLSALSRMTSLLELELHGAAAVQPAGAMGPFCFPSSLTYLSIAALRGRGYAACVAQYLTHLPGCPHLQELRLFYSQQQHPSAHPSAVVGLLAQHCRQLRRLCIRYGSAEVMWDAHVPGLPEPGGAVVDEVWRPDASLAALTGLQRLHAGELAVTHQEDWRFLAQLKALSKLCGLQVTCAPATPAGLALSVLELGCCVQLGGHDLGRLLLAFPRLQDATVDLHLDIAAAAMPPAVQRLTPHPTLQSLDLSYCNNWGSAAAAHMTALAPVLGGLPELKLGQWPSSSSSQPRGGLPDLSPCTALTNLTLRCETEGTLTIEPEQEDFVSMLAPLVQLRHLKVTGAPRLNARVALVLQHMLPHLLVLCLSGCSYQLPLEAAAAHQQREEEIVCKVKQLLRDGLALVIMP